MSNNSLQYDVLLDARNLSCPLPFLKTKLALNSLQAGQILQVIVTDPNFEHDIYTFSNNLNCIICNKEIKDDEFYFWLKVCANDKTSSA